MDRVEVSTIVYLPPEQLYEFLVDFPRYAKYSDYLRDIERHGDGSPGTQYDLTFAWWKLTYTARSEVTAVEPPTRIDWQLVKDIDAQGYWEIEPAPEAKPDNEDHASRVWLVIEFAPESAEKGALDIPRFVSFDWLVRKVRAKVRAEAEAIVERMITDLEGRRREVELEIHETPGSV
ncbi:MAG: SRPBCC family protein [Halovenus sp.]